MGIESDRPPVTGNEDAVTDVHMVPTSIPTAPVIASSVPIYPPTSASSPPQVTQTVVPDTSTHSIFTPQPKLPVYNTLPPIPAKPTPVSVVPSRIISVADPRSKDAMELCNFAIAALKVSVWLYIAICQYYSVHCMNTYICVCIEK